MTQVQTMTEYEMTEQLAAKMNISLEEAKAALEAGNCYYVLTYADEADKVSTSYLKPFTATVEAGQSVAFEGAFWRINDANKKRLDEQF